MNTEKAFERVVYDETGSPLRWVVQVDASGYRCQTFGLTNAQADQLDAAQPGEGEGQGPDTLDLSDPTDSAHFADIDDARRHFATDIDSFLYRAAVEFFAHIDPARYSYDRIQSTALGLMLDRAGRAKALRQFGATHTLNFLTSGDKLQLWSIVAAVLDNRYAAHVWNLTSQEFSRIADWLLDFEIHLAPTAPVDVPTFDRAPDRRGDFIDPEALREFLGGTHPHLVAASREAMHLLLPNLYPAASPVAPAPHLDLFALKT